MATENKTTKFDKLYNENKEDFKERGREARRMTVSAQIDSAIAEATMQHIAYQQALAETESAFVNGEASLKALVNTKAAVAEYEAKIASLVALKAELLG